MNGFHLQRERQRLGLSTDELADELGLPEEQLRQWERQGNRIPNRHARVLQWYLASAAHDHEMAKSGLPECGWVTRWESEFSPLAPGAHAKIAELEGHASNCVICRRRTEHAKRLPEVPDYPGGVWMRALELIVGIVEPFERLRGPRRAAAILGVVFCLFGVARLFRHLRFYEPLGILIYLMAITAMIALGVTVYHGMHPFLGRGSLGRWIARCTAGITAMMGFIGIFIISGYSGILNRDGDPVSWVAGLTLAAVMGVLYATLWPFADYFRQY